MGAGRWRAARRVELTRVSPRLGVRPQGLKLKELTGAAHKRWEHVVQFDATEPTSP